MPGKSHRAAFEWGETFSKHILDRVTPIATSAIDPEMLSPVFGLEPSKKTLSPPVLSQSERFWVNWFQAFSEIVSSVERLDQAIAFLSHFPSVRHLRFHSISEADWLRYHIEMYLHEQYILSERLVHFARRLAKLAARRGDQGGISEANRLEGFVRIAFAAPVQTRGSHVHRTRLDDEALRNLDTVVLLTKRGKMERKQLGLMRAVRLINYLKALQKWRKGLKDNLRNSKNVCKAFLEAALPIILRNEPNLISNQK